MSYARPRVRYEHVIQFRAVHSLTGNSPVPIPVHGHDYRLTLGFESDGLELADDELTKTAVTQATEFVGLYLDGEDLSTMHFRTTPAALAWYISEQLGGVGRAAGLADVTITVDRQHTHIYRIEDQR